MEEFQQATLGGGCFWCLEAVYSEMEGVVSVTSGYMGGHLKNPSYREVCTGTTGHIEVVQITFDPSVTSFREILEVFFAIHDPTTPDRQGNDVGPQYRSAIFFHSGEQRTEAERMIREIEASGQWSNPVVTEVRPAEVFWAAEHYHQHYFRDNPYQPYCQFVISPKVRKFRAKFQAKRKKTA